MAESSESDDKMMVSSDSDRIDGLEIREVIDSFRVSWFRG